MNEVAISTSELTKYYGKVRGVEGLYLTVENGEIFGYLGPNGAGKTTTIRLFLNLIFPTKGNASILGKDIVKESLEIRKFTGYITSDVNLYPKMTAGEYLDFISRVGNKKPVIQNKLIDMFPVELNRKVGDLSTGNKRKVSIIAGLQSNPEILILDEPTLGLDPLMQKQFYDLLVEFKNEGKTIFLSSHNLPEVEKVCDRVGILKEGRLVAVENVRDLATKKVRDVEIWFSKPVSVSNLTAENVVLVESYDSGARFKVRGEIGDFLKKLSAYPVKDLVITHASLEEVFLSFYSNERNSQ